MRGKRERQMQIDELGLEQFYFNFNRQIDIPENKIIHKIEKIKIYLFCFIILFHNPNCFHDDKK